MAEVKSYVRLWPLAFALVGVAGFVYAGLRWTASPKQAVEIVEPDTPVVDAGPDEHFEKVRTELQDEFATYPGKVHAENVVRVGTIDDERFKVPVEKILHEPGEMVKKGDVLVSLYKPQIETAIAKAKAAGKTDDVERFRRYLDNADIKAPCDGVVLEINRTLGEVPIPGLALVTMTDLHGFRFNVDVPASVQGASMPLSTKFEVELAEDWGKVGATVTQFRDQVGDQVPVVLSLEPHQGLEEGLDGTIRVPAGKKEVGLLPKAAVLHRADVPYVRAWDPDSKSIVEKTVKTGEEKGPDVIVIAGVFPGDSVVVPGKAHD